MSAETNAEKMEQEGNKETEGRKGRDRRKFAYQHEGRNRRRGIDRRKTDS